MTDTKRRAFLCHASEDKPIVEKLALYLHSEGIDTFFDKWEMGTGDSLRQKIDSGLEDCTHFVPILSEISIQKPWVNAEMDAAFVRKLEGLCSFLPVRYNLPVNKLPALISGIIAGEISGDIESFKRLAEDIHGISRKPPVANKPARMDAAFESDELSPAATKIVELLVSKSETGNATDPQIKSTELIELLDFSNATIKEALDELAEEGYIVCHDDINAGSLGCAYVTPHKVLFIEFDHLIHTWNPEEDAIEIAAHLVNTDSGINIQKYTEETGWNIRRINPAIHYLEAYDLIQTSEELSWPYAKPWIRGNSRTKGFLRDHRNIASSPPSNSNNLGEASAIFTPWFQSSEYTWRNNIESAGLANEAAGCPLGYYCIGYQLIGSETHPSLVQLKDLLKKAKVRHTGWPLWIVFSNEGALPFPTNDGEIECWIGRNTKHNTPAHADWWLASPEGKFFIARGYKEDSHEDKMNPGQHFCLTVAVWQAAECLLHARNTAAAFGGVSDIYVKTRWTGLNGRSLKDCTGDRMLMETLECKAENKDTEIIISTKDIDTELAKYTHKLLAPVYELFDFFELPVLLVEEEIAKMQRNTF